jgi:hypothetical protein
VSLGDCLGQDQLAIEVILGGTLRPRTRGSAQERGTECDRKSYPRDNDNSHKQSKGKDSRKYAEFGLLVLTKPTILPFPQAIATNSGKLFERNRQRV